MAQVRGIGGIFFKSKDPKSLYSWYKQHLGIAATPGEGAMFHWRSLDGQETDEMTVWSIFPDSTTYLKNSKAEFMVNYIVDNLDELMAELKAAGVEVDDNIEHYDYGNFGWITDPDGNRIELWEPKTSSGPAA